MTIAVQLLWLQFRTAENVLHYSDWMILDLSEWFERLTSIANGPGFNLSIFRHSGIGGAAYKAVLNKVLWKNIEKSPCLASVQQSSYMLTKFCQTMPDWHNSHSLEEKEVFFWPNHTIYDYRRVHSARLSLQSSELVPPHPQASVAPHPFGSGGGDTLTCWRRAGGANSDKGTNTKYIIILWRRRFGTASAFQIRV